MTLAERIEKFNNLMGDIVPPEVKKDLLDKGFFTAPASTKYHGNYEGGLFDHSYMVARYLKKLTEECRLDWQNPRSPLLVGMFHDLCKMDNYQHPVIAETLRRQRKSETIPSGNMLWTLCSRVTAISRSWCWHSISSSPRKKSCVFAITWELFAISPSGTIIHERCINIQMFCGHTSRYARFPCRGGVGMKARIPNLDFCSIRHNRLSPMTRTSFRRLPRLRRMIAARKSTSISVLSVSHRFGVAPVPGSM